MKLLCLTIAALLSGCAYNVTVMPRDSGKTYTGSMEGSGGGTGMMTVSIDGDACTGPVAKVASNESFGFATLYGRNNKGGFASASGSTYSDGDVTLKAMLSCNSGKGFRCDVTGRGASGGGTCLDDQGKIYDLIVIRK